mmetsp:Transcript_20025/g.28361  ORF Transcript_20025/g.28361 Transcript_20025/m.28361 type:complete len:521 (-) Transcript_20025:70-1632(-)
MTMKFAVFASLFLTCLQIPSTISLSLSPKSQQPVKRVAVIGAGITGLSLAHALENSPDLAALGGNGEPIEVTLFEARSVLDYNQGSGVQINGGMSVLKRINPDLQRKVADAGLPLTKISSRTKTWFGRDNPFDTLLEMNVEECIKQVGGKAEETLIIDGEVLVYTIQRGELQKIMIENLPKEASGRLQLGKTLTGIQGNKDGITCDFADGSSFGNFDLVVGCDGVKTAVKEYIDTKKISKDPSEREGRAIYSGLRVKFAVQDGDDEFASRDRAEYRQYFGENGGYALAGEFGAGKNKPPAKGAFFIFNDKDYNGPFKKKEAKNAVKAAENADWMEGETSLREETLQQLKESSIPDLEVGPIIADSDHFFEIGIYFHNPFTLSGWSKEVPDSGGRFCVLAGDSAHAMPPFLGQGANQGMQDAYCLATKIYEYNARASGIQLADNFGDENMDEEKRSDLKFLFKEYEQKRWWTTTQITAKSIFLGYLEVGNFGAKFRDVFFFVLGKLGVARKVFIGSATPEV